MTDKNSVIWLFNDDFKTEVKTRVSSSFGDYSVLKTDFGIRLEIPDDYILKRAKNIQEDNE